MADEYYNNKIVTTDGDVLMDVTQDTATPETVLEGETFHLRSGAPATGTYRPGDEIEARLMATVGHSSKNLLDLNKYTYSSGISNVIIDAATGSLSYTGTGTHISLSFYAADLGVEMYGKTYTVSCINNLASTVDGRLAIRKAGTNRIVTRVGFDSTGKKSITFTPDVETFPNGWYISVMATGSKSTTGKIDVSNLMLRDGSIADDTFESYVTPTDEAKQDKPVELVSTATNTFIYPSVSDLKSKYSMLLVTFANSSRSNFASVWIPTNTIKNNINEQSNYNYASTGFMNRSAPVSIWDDGVHISSAESDETIISIQAFPK